MCYESVERIATTCAKAHSARLQCWRIDDSLRRQTAWTPATRVLMLINHRFQFHVEKDRVNTRKLHTDPVSNVQCKQ